MRFVKVDDYNKGAIVATIVSDYGTQLTLHFNEVMTVDGQRETFLYTKTTIIHGGRIYGKKDYFAQPTKFDLHGQATEIAIYELDASEIESTQIAYYKANLVLINKCSKRAELSREITEQRRYIKKLRKSLYNLIKIR